MDDSASVPFLAIRVSRGVFKVSGRTRYTGGAIVPDGPFGRWEWNGRTLLVENDDAGVFPLFWHASRDSIAVSPSIHALLQNGASAEVDDAAMAVFLRAGYFVGDDTPFASVRALPPAARLTWDGSVPTLTSGWRHRRRSDLSRHELVDAFGTLTARSVARVADAALRPCTVPLTGGHDSRHLAFALREHGVPFSCVTVEPYPPAAGDDVAIARLVAAALGADHTVLPQRHDRVAAEREKNALTHLCTDEHVQFLPLRDRFTGRNDLLFDGLGGDVLSQSQRLDPVFHQAFVDGRLDEVVDRVLGERASIEPALAGLLSPPAMRRFSRSAAAARVFAEAARHTAAPNPIASFFFFNRMRREIALAPYALLRPGMVTTPFLAPAVVDLLLAAPFERVADRRLHTDTLHRRYPQHATLPFDRKQHGAADPALVRRTAVALASRVAMHRGTLLNRRGVVARLARAVTSGAPAHLWFLPKLVHLMDVEMRTRGPLRSPRPRSGAGLAVWTGES